AHRALRARPRARHRRGQPPEPRARTQPAHGLAARDADRGARPDPHPHGRPAAAGLAARRCGRPPRSRSAWTPWASSRRRRAPGGSLRERLKSVYDLERLNVRTVHGAGQRARPGRA
ncbi:MAG: hypothetical protein MZU95_13520, partial [Desulfomicrobium escambiense]|nr:hypothetical protein [Desulfomicrobium escambiense]